MTPLVLASTSPHRRALLARLGLPFETAAPRYEERRLPGLSPPELALHHALGKARSAAEQFPGRIVIGSDQVAELDGEILGKPGTRAAAIDQLVRMSGRQLAFYTGLAVLSAEREESWVEPFRVRLRELTRDEIEFYVAAEQPVGCAGSFQIEKRGIALMDSLEGRDFTALIGLPLIALTRLLDRLGVRVLSAAAQGFTNNGKPS